MSLTTYPWRASALHAKSRHQPHVTVTFLRPRGNLLRSPQAVSDLERPVVPRPGAGVPLPETTLRPLPVDPPHLVDDVGLGNPLQRAERLGTGWIGVIVDLEGVLLDYDSRQVSDASWQQLAREEGFAPLSIWALRKAEHMKNEQVIQDVFEWAWNRKEVDRLARRREELYVGILENTSMLVAPGMLRLLRLLSKHHVPVAAVSSGPRSRADWLLERAAVSGGALDAISTADDVQRSFPDPSVGFCAAAALQRPPMRCAMLCASNALIEAAHNAGMQAVAVVPPGRPAHELIAADKVCRRLEDLSLMELRSLFAREETTALLPAVEPQSQPAHWDFMRH